MSSRPDFTFGLSIGPQRCGTQHLRRYFKARDDVCLPADAREIFYFDRHFQRGPEFYFSHFHPRDRNHMLLELTTTAFDHAEAPRRALNLMGRDVRLICPLRHPVERAYTVYEDYIRYGLVHGDIEQAVEQAPQILFSSRYAEHLGRWADVFGMEKITILFYEQWEEDPGAFYSAACQGLGLVYEDLDLPPAAPSGAPENAILRLFSEAQKILPWEGRRNMRLSERSRKTRRWLKDRLKGEIRLLKKMVAAELPYWEKQFFS